MLYNPEIIGTIIYNERKKRNWSQEKLGQKIGPIGNKKTPGIVGKQISNYENGKTVPPMEVMFKLCEIFDCELGYLLGEESYSEGTKLQTAILDTLKLSTTSANAITNITGTDRSCLSYGYRSTKYIRILNEFISSSMFPVFIKALGTVDNYSEEKKAIYSEIEKKYGSDNFSKAFNVYYGNSDYEHDPDIEPLPDIICEIIKELQNAESKCYDMEFGMKVARYEAQEALETLVRDLYPLS